MGLEPKVFVYPAHLPGVLGARHPTAKQSLPLNIDRKGVQLHTTTTCYCLAELPVSLPSPTLLLPLVHCDFENYVLGVRSLTTH